MSEGEVEMLKEKKKKKKNNQTNKEAWQLSLTDYQ